jgi:hypothetical protein
MLVPIGDGGGGAARCKRRKDRAMCTPEVGAEPASFLSFSSIPIVAMVVLRRTTVESSELRVCQSRGLRSEGPLIGVA